MLQLVLYTTLWIDSQHVDYKIYYCPLSKFYVFKPTVESGRHPLFHVSGQNGQWVFNGMPEPAVQEQAIEDIGNIGKMKNAPLL